MTTATQAPVVTLQFWILARDLLAALQKVTPVASRAATSGPELVLIRADGERATLTCTDDDTLLQVEAPVSVGEHGAVCLRAQDLLALAAKLGPRTEVGFRVAGGRARIVCRELVADPVSMSAEAFPEIPPAEGGWSMPADVLRRLVSHTTFAVSTDESRPLLHGVRWEIARDEMRMVATNGHILAMQDVEVPGERPETNLIVPGAALHRALPLLASSTEVRVVTTADRLTLIGDGARFDTRLIEGPYPDYQRVIPTEHERVAVVDRDRLIGAIDRVAAFAHWNTRRIGFAFGGSDLCVFTKTEGLGECKEFLAVEYRGSDRFTIGFNADYLLRILRLTKGGPVTLSFRGPEHGVLIEGAIDPTFSALCMPLRLLE